MQYRLISEHADFNVGTIVYKCEQYDYGLSSQDSRETGIQHISVTLKSDGSYPFQTVPVHKLQQIIQ